MNEAELLAAYGAATAIHAEQEAVLDIEDRLPGRVKCHSCITMIDVEAKRDICRFCFRSLKEQDRRAKALER